MDFARSARRRKTVSKTTFEKKSLSEVKVGSAGMFGYSASRKGLDGIEMIITAQSLWELESIWRIYFNVEIDLLLVKKTITFEVQQ